MQREVMLMGYYGASNLGDDLMLLCLSRVLARHNFRVTVLAEDAEQVRKAHNLRAEQNYAMLGQFGAKHALFRGKAVRLAKKVRASHTFFAGGGDIFRDSLGFASFSYQVEKIIWAILCGRPVVLINVGITRPSTAAGKQILSWILKRCKMIIVRDQRSVDVCRKLAPTVRVHYLPDVVLALPTLFEAEIRTAPPVPLPARPYVIVSLRSGANVYGQFPLDANRIRNLGKALDSVVQQHGMDIKFVACQTTCQENDHDLHAQVQKAMGASADKTYMLRGTADVPELARLFNTASGVIAMRLHAGVLGVAFRRPTMLLPYDTKVAEFGAMTGVQHTLSAEDLDSPAIATQRVDRFMAEKQTVRIPAEAELWNSAVLQEALS